MYYLVYKTTNLVNGKIYIGCHQTSTIDDGYIGSGSLLKSAIEKYGKDKFSREILSIFDNPERMFEMEAKLVNIDFVKESTNYNQKLGGIGGQSNEINQLTNEKIAEKRKTDPEFNDKFLKQRSENGITSKARKAGIFSPGKRASFKGKRHSEQTKQKIGERSAKHQEGAGNSQYGTCWVYNIEKQINKKIKKEQLNDYLLEGWVSGRKMKF